MEKLKLRWLCNHPYHEAKNHLENLWRDDFVSLYHFLVYKKKKKCNNHDSSSFASFSDSQRYTFKNCSHWRIFWSSNIQLKLTTSAFACFWQVKFTRPYWLGRTQCFKCFKWLVVSSHRSLLSTGEVFRTSRDQIHMKLVARVKSVHLSKISVQKIRFLNHV